MDNFYARDFSQLLLKLKFTCDDLDGKFNNTNDPKVEALRKIEFLKNYHGKEKLKVNSLISNLFTFLAIYNSPSKLNLD